MQTFRERMADESGFVHRRIIGAVGGFIRGGPLGAVGGFLTGGVSSGTSATAPVTCPPGFRFDGRSCVPSQPVAGLRRLIGVQSVPGLPRPLPAPIVPQPRPPRGRAITVTQATALAPGQMGEAVMGRFGAGFEPDVVEGTTRSCGRGAVLGVDGICYNKRDLRNDERFWPRGRRPLLTGGEVRAISVASSAAKKLQRKQKQLEALGLLKKPTARRQRALPAHHFEHPVSGHDSRHN